MRARERENKQLLAFTLHNQDMCTLSLHNQDMCTLSLIFFTSLSARKAKKATTQLLHINLCFQNNRKGTQTLKSKKKENHHPSPRSLFLIFTDVYMLGTFPRRRKSREEKNVWRFSGQGLIYTLGQTPSSSLRRCSIYHRSGLSTPPEWCSEGGIVLLWCLPPCRSWGSAGFDGWGALMFGFPHHCPKLIWVVPQGRKHLHLVWPLSFWSPTCHHV